MVTKNIKPKSDANFLGAASTLIVSNFNIFFVFFESIKSRLYSLLKNILVTKSRIRKKTNTEL